MTKMIKQDITTLQQKAADGDEAAMILLAKTSVRTYVDAFTNTRQPETHLQEAAVKAIMAVVSGKSNDERAAGIMKKVWAKYGHTDVVFKHLYNS